jgi:branched-chain amino acid transport system substrate-binding protein
MHRAPALLAIAGLVAFAAGCGGGGSSAKDATSGPIVIGTANSLTGVLAPFETAINHGMDIAVDEINARGGVRGRKLEVIHVDAKSDLNLSATAVLDVIEKGAQIVVPICDADYGAPGARAANDKGIMAITCAGAPGIGRQSVGPLTFNTYAGAPTESAIDAEYGYYMKDWRRAYLLCDRLVEYTKVMCEAFRTRWKSLGGSIVGEDTFVQSDVSIAAQVTRLVNGPKPDVVVLASFPGGSPAIRELRARYDGPLIVSAAYSGTFWLKPTPHLSNVWIAAIGSSYGDDPRDAVNAFFASYKRRTGKPAQLDSYPLLGYSLVQTIAKGVEIAGTTDGNELAEALETFRAVQLLAGPTTYSKLCHVPVERSLLMIRYENGRPRSTGDLVLPQKVPAYRC